MATHSMHLQDKYFEAMASGEKNIELRLNDEKRKKVRLGDYIEFQNDSGDKYTAEVLGLLHYKNFADLARDFSSEVLAGRGISIEELIDDLEEFYTPGLQRKYGVIGFRVAPVTEKTTIL